MAGPLDARIQWQKDMSEDQELTPAARHVGMVIATQLDLRGPRGRVAITYLMRATGHGRRHIFIAVALLKTSGWLEVERSRSRGRSTTYRAVNPGLFRRSEVHPAAPQEISPEVHPAAPQTPLEVHPAAPQTPLEVHPAAPVLSKRRTEEKDVRMGRGFPGLLITMAAADQDNDAETEPEEVDEVLVDQVLASLGDTNVRPRIFDHVAGLRQIISQRLAAGYSPDEIHDAAQTIQIRQPKNPSGALAWAIPQHRPEVQGDIRGAWCGKCEADDKRVIIDDGGYTRHCPECSPYSFAAAVAR